MEKQTREKKTSERNDDDDDDDDGSHLTWNRLIEFLSLFVSS